MDIHFQSMLIAGLLATGFLLLFFRGKRIFDRANSPDNWYASSYIHSLMISAADFIMWWLGIICLLIGVYIIVTGSNSINSWIVLIPLIVLIRVIRRRTQTPG